MSYQPLEIKSLESLITKYQGIYYNLAEDTDKASLAMQIANDLIKLQHAIKSRLEWMKNPAHRDNPILVLKEITGLE